MATIEEKAIVYEDYLGRRSYTQTAVQQAYIAGATEQDRIARQEERERCIEAAQYWYCIRCCDTSGEECHYCHIKEHIRKAMEGGEG